MPAVRGTAALHRPPARLPQPMGDLVRGHPQGDDPPGHHHAQQPPDDTPPRTRPLRPPSPRRHTARHGPITQLPAPAGCLSRVPRRVACTVLRRGVPENGTPYPTRSITSATSPTTKTDPNSAPEPPLKSSPASATWP